MSPVSKATQPKTHTTTEGLGHSLEGRHRVTTPVNGVTLTTSRGRTSEHNGLILALALLDDLEGVFVVQERVVVVHLLGVGAIEVHRVTGGDTFTEVSLRMNYVRP